MDEEAIRLLIQRKLRDGRLPHNDIGRFWASPGNGETCDACESPITKEYLVMEEGGGTRLQPGAPKPMQLHVLCYQVWIKERRALESR